MILYASIGIALFVLAFLRLIGVVNRRFERPLMLCITILAFTVSWIRWKTGTDWATYVAFFHILNSVSAAHSQDWWGPAYAYLAVLVNSIGGGYTEFLFILAAVQYTALYYFLTRGSAAPLVALFILFCGNFYGIYFVRETVAVALFLGFVYYYYQNRYTAAIAAAAASIAFHISAVVPICLVIFVVRFSWKKVFIGLAGAVAGGYYLFRDVTFATLTKLLPALGYFGGGFVEVKQSDLGTTTRAYLKLIFMIIIVLVAGYRFQERARGTVDREWYAFCWRSALAILVVIACFLPFSQIIARFTMYAMPLVAVTMSNYEFRFPRISLDGAIYIGFLLMFFVELEAFYSGYATMYYPVKTIFTR